MQRAFMAWGRSERCGHVEKTGHRSGWCMNRIRMRLEKVGITKNLSNYSSGIRTFLWKSVGRCFPSKSLSTFYGYSREHGMTTLKMGYKKDLKIIFNQNIPLKTNFVMFKANLVSEVQMSMNILSHFLPQDEDGSVSCSL